MSEGKKMGDVKSWRLAETRIGLTVDAATADDGDGGDDGDRAWLSVVKDGEGGGDV